MIAHQEMHLFRKLALQCRDEIEQLMRLVAAEGIAKGAVNHFLEDEMAPGMSSQVGFQH